MTKEDSKKPGAPRGAQRRPPSCLVPVWYDATIPKNLESFKHYKGVWIGVDSWNGEYQTWWRSGYAVHEGEIEHETC